MNSEKKNEIGADVGIHVAIKAGQLTVLDLDLGEGDGQTVTFKRVVAPDGRLIGGSRVQARRDFSILRKLA
jgi:hypothetical protein